MTRVGPVGKHWEGDGRRDRDKDGWTVKCRVDLNGDSTVQDGGQERRTDRKDRRGERNVTRNLRVSLGCTRLQSPSEQNVSSGGSMSLHTSEGLRDLRTQTTANPNSSRRDWTDGQEGIAGRGEVQGRCGRGVGHVRTSSKRET